MRRVLGLALAAERVRDLGCEPAERLTAGVDDDPVALAVRRCGHKSLHLQTGEASGRDRNPPERYLYWRPLVVPAQSLPGCGRGRGTALARVLPERLPVAKRPGPPVVA